jgi:hypothetical protein
MDKSVPRFSVGDVVFDMRGYERSFHGRDMFRGRVFVVDDSPRVSQCYLVIYDYDYLHQWLLEDWLIPESEMVARVLAEKA